MDNNRIGVVDTVDDEVLKVNVNNSVKNTREVTDYLPYGIDSRPVKGIKALVVGLGNLANRILIGVRVKPANKIAKAGEIRLYNAFGVAIYLREDGKIEINGNTASTMTFQAFEVVYNNLISELQSHQHPNGNLGSPTGTMINPLTSAATDMRGAENDKVLTND